MATDPRPADVFDRASATYDRVGVPFFTPFGRHLVRFADLRAGERVLDVGTGRGAVLGPAAEAVGPAGHVRGIDLAPGMVALTAADAAAAGWRHVVVAEEDAQTPSDVGAPFDAVLSSLVLFFCADPAAALQRWARLVAPGGRLGLVTFLDDPDDARLREVLREFLPPQDMASEGPTPFELVRSPGWLDAALSGAGLPQITSEATRHATVFDDAGHWWRWAWSHGMRLMVEQIDPGEHDRVIAAVQQELEANRLPDGQLGLHVTVRYTVARR